MTYEEQLLALASQDERIVVMTAENRAAIRNVSAKLGDRFIDVGIAEMTMVGAAAGLALRGRMPIVHALATFLTLRAFEFIRDDVGIAELPVILVGGVPGFLSEANGPTHQAIEDVSLMRSIPGINIFCPADEEELVLALPHLLASAQPWYVRYYAGKPVREHTEEFAIGKSEMFPSELERDQTTDVTIMTYGFMLANALEAQRILEADGVVTDVINLRTLRPIDDDAILVAALRSEVVVTVEDHLKIGGLYSITAELFQREGMFCDVLPIALDGWFKPALLGDLLEFEGFTPQKIAEKINAFIDESNERLSFTNGQLIGQ